MLELVNISKSFKDFKIRDVSFKVNKGDYYTLLGVSGAGKSLLLELIAGLEKQDSGNIILDGKDITNERIQKRELGLVFQDYALFPHLSVKENISYPLKFKKIRSSEIHKTVLDLALEMSISHLLNRMPNSLSGGELQRVALARTLTLKPKCLLLDEPLASIDVLLKDELRMLLRKINHNGQTIIHVTHDYEETISLATNVAIMHNGKIIQIGTPHEVFQHPKSEFVANLTGIKNFFRVEIRSENTSKIAKINDSISLHLLSECEKGTGYIIIRSEDIILSDKIIESSVVNNFEGIIKEIIPAKLGVEIHIDIGIRLSAIITDKSLMKLKLVKGNTVWASFKASAVKFIEN